MVAHIHREGMNAEGQKLHGADTSWEANGFRVPLEQMQHKLAKHWRSDTFDMLQVLSSFGFTGNCLAV